MAGVMRDCAECHVGGGFNQYYNSAVDATKPFQYNPANRTDYRDANFGASVNTFNTFIDIFGLDGLGFEATDHHGVARDLNPASPTYVGPTYAAKTNDYAQTGALEMDCLMCHLDGYEWDKRRDAIRVGNFDSSRAAGAGLGTPTSGTAVAYDATKVVPVLGALTLDVNVAQKIVATPKSANCASCHMEEYQVDWKKRGEMWKSANDVHFGFGCMSCHERKTGAVVGTTGIVSAAAADKLLGQCDPAKGGTSPFDAMWNPLDKVAFKTCEDCHSPATTPTWDTYGAPRADIAHQNAGLTAKLLQAAGVKNGVASKSHLDIMDCTACHTKNKAGITGGAFVDGTGTDLQGRVALHDDPAVSKDMENGQALHWLGGKLYSANLLTSFFWRDMNDFNYDANQDLRAGGMDALLPAHVSKINLDNGMLKALGADGVITPTEITDRQNLISANIAALTGVAVPLKPVAGTPNFAPRISMLTVPFKGTHNISPADVAWGKNGCTDCHSATSKFYQGAYPVVKDAVTNPTGRMDWTFAANQLATFTKVNGKMDGSEGHPNVVDKHGKRSVAFTLFNPAGGTLRNIDRSEVIYEPIFKDQAPALTTFTTLPIVGGTAAGITNSNQETGTSTKGHILKLNVKETATGTVTNRTWAMNAECTTIAQVITSMGVFATNANNFGFTITDAGATNISINPQAGFEVKIDAVATDFGPFGLGGKAYVNAPQLGVLGGSYAGRPEWVAYLNGITEASAGINVDPVASITSVFTDVDPGTAGVQVNTTAAQPLTAAAAQAGGFSTYAWTSSDGTAIAAGQTSSVTFTTAGLKTITLRVTDEEGKVSEATTSVYAVVAPVAGPIAWADAAGSLGGIATLSTLPTPNKSLKIYWGDGKSETVTTQSVANPDGLATVTRAHTYATAGSKLVKVYVYSSTGVQLALFTQTIAVDGAN
ncbi:MAG: PKD domain-containing protein [Geobacteraceae bacterium]|nr:PKD domain-containing protein [Geobacteraceae bacterium]NTW79649.1 PKD domain-containing protein [Geobacteraceae bacterium]